MTRNTKRVGLTLGSLLFVACSAFVGCDRAATSDAVASTAPADDSAADHGRHEGVTSDAAPPGSRGPVDGGVVANGASRGVSTPPESQSDDGSSLPQSAAPAPAGASAADPSARDPADPTAMTLAPDAAVGVGGDAGGATQAELLEECGVAPEGLKPHFVVIQSSEAPDVELSLAVQGDPAHSPVVLMHGFPDFWCGWARVIPALAERYFVVAADMRGYNRSSKPGDPDDPQDLDDYQLPQLAQDMADVVHFAASQTQQKVGLVAHDWGAIVAWRYAAKFPEDLAKLMAISVPHPDAMAQFSSSADPALREAQLAQTQALTYVTELVMADSPRYYSENEYERLFESLDQKHLQDPGTFPEVERAAYRRMWEADNQSSFKSQIKYYRANFGPTAQAQTGDLMTPVPTTFIAPVHDGAVLYPHSMDYLREHVAPDQPLVLRPIDTGHFPQREVPELLTRMIEQFMDASWQTP